MIIPLSLKADSKRALITTSQGDVRIEVDSALVYARSKQRVDVYLDIGNASADPERLLAQSGFVQENFNAKLIFPFDVGDFSPKFAAAFIQHYGAIVYRKIRRHPRIAQLFERAVCRLEIKDYEALSEDTKQEFVYRLRKGFPIRLRRLIINGQDTVNIRSQQRFANTVITTFGVLFGLAFAMGGSILFNGIGPTSWQGDWWSLKFALFAIAIGICFFSGMDFGALVATLVLRRFISRVSLKLVLLDSGLLPKATINRLTTSMEIARL
jgi:hypothetical protein